MSQLRGRTQMPRSKSARASAVAAVAIACAIGGGPASASAAPGKQRPYDAPASAPSAYCPLDESQSWNAFAAFGDDNTYFLAPSGDFESGATDWTLRGAAVRPGDDGLGVHPGQQVLSLGLGTPGNPVAVSPVFCVTNDHPVFRFTFRSVGAVGPLTTSVRYRGVDGGTHEQVVSMRSSTAARPGVWQPSEQLPLAEGLPLTGAGDVAAVQLVFRAKTRGIATGYQVDNILIDPFRTR